MVRLEGFAIDVEADAPIVAQELRMRATELVAAFAAAPAATAFFLAPMAKVHPSRSRSIGILPSQRRIEDLSRQQQERLQATARLATVGEMARASGVAPRVSHVALCMEALELVGG